MSSLTGLRGGKASSGGLRPPLREFVVLCVALLSAARAAEPAHDLVTVRTGTIPVILSSPHGGTKPIPDVPVRMRTDTPKFQIVRDERTAELTEKLATALAEQLGQPPTLVILRAERKYVDVNRPAEQAYESDRAKPVYDAFHGALRKQCDDIRQKWGRGLLIDVHGQTAEDDVIFRGTLNLETVTALRQRVAPDAYKQLDRALEQSGLRVLPPSTVDDKETRFTGGHIVRTYGSQHPNGVDAVQWEFGANLRQPEVLDQTARDAAKALAEFVRTNYLK
jgi:N-formylglutamate amidohydrolase